jgi:hypothetical protein
MLIQKIKKNTHGVISLVIAGIAIIIAFISIFLNSVSIAILYLIVLMIASFAVSYFYCLKCTARTNCAHVLPGKLTNLFASPKSKNYNFLDYFVTVTALLLIAGIPQYWLIKRMELFFIFWGLLGVAFVEVRSYVCTRCNNSLCPGNKKK